MAVPNGFTENQIVIYYTSWFCQKLFSTWLRSETSRTFCSSLSCISSYYFFTPPVLKGFDSALAYQVLNLRYLILQDICRSILRYWKFRKSTTYAWRRGKYYLPWKKDEGGGELTSESLVNRNPAALQEYFVVI